MAKNEIKLELLTYLEKRGLGKYKIDLTVLNAISDYLELKLNEKKHPISFKNIDSLEKDE